MPVATDTLWTVPRLAEYLGVSVQAVHQMRYRGQGPRGVRVGRLLRFREADVLAWVEQSAEGADRRAVPGH